MAPRFRRFVSVAAMLLSMLVLPPSASASPGAPQGWRAYPNPFTTRFKIEMPESIYPSPADPEAQIRVFDMRGRLVRQWVYLMDGPGHPLIIDWDGRTTNGSPASSGWYIFDIRFRNHPLREGIRFKMLRIRGILDSTYDWSWF